MANARFAWGIDIGNRALKAIKLVREGDALHVDDFEVIEHETVLSNSGDNREALITAALTNFVQRHPVKGGAVSIGVSGQSSFARFIKLPPVEPKKIPEIVRFEAIQQIPFPLDDVEWSYQLFQSAESPDVEVGIFAMRKELINQHIKNFTDQDLNVQVVQMNPLAVYNAMHFDQRIDGTTMIIDLGAENTDLIIADLDTVWMRSIPIGGNNFTETLVKSFKLNFPKAEDLKRNAATSKYARQIFQAMRPVFADLVAEVQRSIGFYASVHRDSRIKKIIAVGGTFKLPGLQKYLQQNLQLDVERIDTFGAGAPSDPKQGATFQDNTLSLVSAYGLALQAMGEGKITSSLLPARIRRERLWQEKTKFFAAAAALFVLGTGIGYGSYFLANMSYEGKAGERGQVQQVLSQAQDLDGKWNTIQGAGAPDRQRIINIRSLTEYRDIWPTILNDLHKSVPPLPADVNQLKQTPRSQRRQIAIETVNTKYFPDMTPVVTAPNLQTFANVPAVQATLLGGGGPTNQAAQDNVGGPIRDTGGLSDQVIQPVDTGSIAGGAAAAVAADASHGFVLTLTGTTPNAQAASFLNETLVKALKAMDKEHYPDGHPFYVANAEVVEVKALRDDSQKLTQIKAIYETALRGKDAGAAPGAPVDVGNGIGGEPGAGTAAAVGPDGKPLEDPKPYMDRVTGEDVRDDQEFTIVVAFVLDPPPKPPSTQPAPGEAPATAPAAAPTASAAPIP